MRSEKTYPIKFSFEPFLVSSTHIFEQSVTMGHFIHAQTPV